MRLDREFEESLVIPVEPDETTLLAKAEELIGQAGRSVDVSFAEHTTRSPGIGALLRSLVAARGNVVRVRLLFSRSAPGWDRLLEHLDRPAASEGFDVRIAHAPLVDSLIVDGRSALLIADSAIGPQASVTRGAEMTSALSALFTAVWNGAAPLPRRIDWDDRARSELAGRILRCLHAGMADELAARELSVSLRTYRRYVADIMTALGASSRFQAGLHAAELGLLPVLGARGGLPDAAREAGPTAGRTDAPGEGNGTFL
ncbi:LuxR family transcriptional regulator [Streptomyces xanthophaeus]|uniref:LuxR family transcriptional regulator n=1 Tax=Streptomyces xanthophaeus TaxID=67385 RepID=UPI00398FB0F9